MEHIQQFYGDSAFKIIFWSILAFFFLNYIVAFKKSRSGSIVVIAGWFDFALLLVPIIGLVTLGFMEQDNNQLYNEQLFYWYVIACSVSILLTLIYSVVSNKKNILNIAISFFAKLFIILISILVILLFFGVFASKKDGRYRDGTRGNFQTTWLALVSSIAIFLITSLVKKR